MSITVYENTETFSNICVIDPTTRKISIPDGFDLLGVQYDRNACLIHFQVNSWPTEIFDMTDAQIRIIYKNAAGELGSYLVTNKFITNGNCTFTWEVDSFALKEKGNVEFWVCAEILDGDVVKREWHTLKAIGKVEEGLLHVSGSVEEESHDEIMQLLAYVKKTCDDSTSSISSTKTSALNEIKTNSDQTLSSIDTKHSNAINDIENTKSEAVVTINNLIDTLGLFVKGGKICQRLRVK